MCCCIKTRSLKFKTCGYASIATGVILLALGISWPFIMNPLIIMGAKQSTALMKDNQDQWRGIPGKFDISIDRFTHVYNVTNRDDVSSRLSLSLSIVEVFCFCEVFSRHFIKLA